MSRAIRGLPVASWPVRTSDLQPVDGETKDEQKARLATFFKRQFDLSSIKGVLTFVERCLTLMQRTNNLESLEMRREIISLLSTQLYGTDSRPLRLYLKQMRLSIRSRITRYQLHRESRLNSSARDLLGLPDPPMSLLEMNRL